MYLCYRTYSAPNCYIHFNYNRGMYKKHTSSHVYDHCRKMSKVASLWMDKVPDEPNEEIEALQALIYEDPPEVRAENFKDQGNECFKQGKKYYNDAIIYYTKAIEQNSPDNTKNSVYFTNRAAVDLMLGMFQNQQHHHPTNT